MFAKTDRSKLKLPVKYSELDQTERREIRYQYIIKQRRRCCHCKMSLDLPPPDYIQMMKIDRSLFPENFFSHPVHLHHNHDTDLTIGAIHCYCNAVLWEYEGE